jgi:hypothetical protein
LGFDAERGRLLGTDGEVGGDRRAGESERGGKSENEATHANGPGWGNCRQCARRDFENA